jgi:hypothetical protein
MGVMHAYRAFGLTIGSDFELPGLRAASAEPDLALRLRDDAAPEVEMTTVWATRFPGGIEVTAQVAEGGAQRLRFGDRASFDIADDARAVDCRLAHPGDAAALRFLLDTVLWWVCLTRGAEALHASAIELPAGVFAVAGRTGGGKTSLAVALMRRGHKLFSDDVLVFDRRDGALVARPGPPLMNLPFAAGDTSDVGTVLARFEDQGESWVAVKRSSAGPSPVAGILLLERAAGLELGASEIDATVLDVMPHVWGLPHAQEGARERFDAISDIARAARVFRITAGLEVSPASLAALVEEITCNAETHRVRV